MNDTSFAPPRRPLAAFDFDGTLTYKDSFVSFLLETCGFSILLLTCLTNPGLWLHYLATRDRGVLKARLLYKLLGPITRAELEGRVARFVRARGAALFRPDARAEWDRCRSTHERVIVTASPESLVRPLGEMIGADRVVGTRLKFSADGRLTPQLEGPNCRGAEKMRRLREAYGDRLDLDLAYGDTAGDDEMLKAARFGHYRAFTGKP